MKFTSLSVIGLGYIGLPTAAVFASRKIKVIGVDVNQKTVDTINQGKIHIVEPDLDIVVHAAVTEGYLRATTAPEPAEAFIVAVPTPFKGDNHEPDLSYIQAASKAIAPVLQKGNLVILESTSPVGATEQMAAWLAEERSDLTFPQSHGENSDIRIAHCPERVLPGQVMRELIENDRVIGGMTPKCSAFAIDLYKEFVTGECVLTDVRTAEMAKLTENSFRDTNIAFANELSMICDEIGVNVWELIRIANRHPRVSILEPGPGVGGHCIAVDPWFIISKTPEKANIIKMARLVNKEKVEWVIEKIKSSVAELVASGKHEKELKVSFYGLSFKQNIDDLRESPAIDIVKTIESEIAAEIHYVEPNINYPCDYFKRATLRDFDFSLNNSDLHVLLVKHDEFLNVIPKKGVTLDFKGVWSC